MGESAPTFKELLVFQLDPPAEENAQKVSQICKAVIQSQLSITKRLKQGFVDFGVRQGTKILSKGVNIAKFGLNLFIKTDDKETQEDDNRENTNGEAQAEKEPEVELKWVTVY